MTKRAHTKLGRIVAGLHILFAILVVVCLSLIIFGGTDRSAFEGGSIFTWRFAEAILWIFMVGWFLSIPIVIFDILYAAKHLLPGDRKRIPVIMSAAFFGFFTIFLCVVLIIAQLR